MSDYRPSLKHDTGTTEALDEERWTLLHNAKEVGVHEVVIRALAGHRTKGATLVVVDADDPNKIRSTFNVKTAEWDDKET